MHLAHNDNGPNPCAGVAPELVRPGLCHFALMGRPGAFGLVRLRFHPEVGFVRDAPAMSPHPLPQIFGYRGGAPAAPPSPHQSSTRKPRPAFIRGVVERAI